MRLIIQNDYEAMSRWAAAYLVRKITTAGADRPFVLGLPTGSSPVGMYRALIDFHRQGLVSFRNVVTFNMDEYVGLGENDEQSYHRFMWDTFFSKVDIPAEQVHILDGLAGDLEAECRNYEQAIEDAGGIDLFVGGIGEDGHIAFNEPGSSLSSRTRIKTLTHDTKVANSRFFGGEIGNVPDRALTVGVGTIMASREVLLLASGHRKARALEQAVQQGVNHMVTVSCLQLHPKAIIVCDQEATLELKVGTVKYFTDIESPNLDHRELLP
jgi:glucosamine-6-phosphate deaminase